MSTAPILANVPKKILVLGATSGIAEATCRIWAAEGASLFLVARNEEKLSAVAQDLRTRGASYVDTAVADLDDTDTHPTLLAHAINSLTGMDIAYLAHGILGDQPAAEQSFETAAQILHTNFIAPVSLLTWLANYLRPAPRRRPRRPLLRSRRPRPQVQLPLRLLQSRPHQPSSPASATASTARESPSSPSSPAPSKPP